MEERLKWVLYDFPLMSFDALLSCRTVWFTSLAGLQLRWNGVGKRSPLLWPLPRVRGNCQQPAGHWYCAGATAARSGRRCEHRRAEKCSNRSGEAVPLWAQVPRLPHSITSREGRPDEMSHWCGVGRGWLTLIHAINIYAFWCDHISKNTLAHAILYFSSV